jgi:SAM-dependent methyltransferase
VAEEDRARWEAKYAGGHRGPEAPDPLLAEALAHAPRGGRALDVACGSGRHAVALARAGYAVDAVDLSPSALAEARARAGALPIRFVEADLDAFEPGPRAYAVVVCVDFTAERLAPRLMEALAPGGVLVYAARPRALCRFGPRPGDVARWFAALEPILHRETAERAAFLGRRR